MGVDHNSLEDSASVGVTAVILIGVSFMTLHMMLKYMRNPKYPAAQHFLVVIFFMPISIGWAAWVQVLVKKDSKGLDFLINLFKSVCIACFMLYMERIMGWVREGDRNIYSENQKFEVLCHGLPHRFLCFKVQPTQNVDEAKAYLRRIEFLVYQCCVVFVVIGVIGIIMITTGDNYSFTNTTQNKVFTIFFAIKSISSLVALIALMRLVWYNKRIPELEKFEFFHKVVILKLGFLFTEAQPLFIEFCANYNLIANTSIYSVAEITAYTNSLLIVSEMIIINFLFLIEFPISDYEVPPADTSRLEPMSDNGKTVIATN